ncbi:Short-chain dehydrogenase/reductase SDR [Penicillium bovifimosum]|uniref:Short-chain dehydrogenase/reductase SDR n=1 Tax=Penicillium bovifimosum TaxID=126998 RepID=A0A9W9GNT1_9EURO|nr:Short-chain dehydrogenase/reductase SDR [Penicillium bovifimosum]KAJ5124245.1 Short-chain dehydrogenase/reductase SDR [Penicillium bovifimosum]
MASLFRLLKMQYTPPTDPKAVTFAGKIVLLTGATSGLGFEAAIKILNLGAESLIIGSRDLQRGRQTKLKLEKLTNRGNVVHVWELEMNSFASVKNFAEQVNKEVTRLDVAILNAGIWNKDYHQSPEGWEEDLQVNTLSTSLLALLLLPKLKKSAYPDNPSHLSVVSSQQFVQVKPESVQTDGILLAHLNDPDNFAGPKQYGVSKLLLELVMKKIAVHIRGDDETPKVVVNTVSPGLCMSSLGRKYDSWWEKCAKWILYTLFARTTEQGSRLLVSAVLQGLESQGRCWRNDGYLDESAALTTGPGADELQAKVWSEVITVLTDEAEEVNLIARGLYPGL